MGKIKLVVAGLAVAALTVVGAGAPAEAGNGGGGVSGQNLWCC